MPSVITTQGLTKKYQKATVLKNINLEIQPGEVIGYIGPNGAGKSTTIKILTGIIPEFEGEVNVLGFDIRTQAPGSKTQNWLHPRKCSSV
jgi:ABC-2 type transport system ATP-binding protein